MSQYEDIVRRLADLPPAHVLRRVTFGQGHEGIMCSLCGRNDYDHHGTVEHADDCVWVAAMQLVDAT